MTTITLNDLKAQYAKLAEMINAFEKQQEQAVLTLPEATINLAFGERYAGILLGEDGQQSYHLVLLPGQANDITWQKAMGWASRLEDENVISLPTPREQALLYANLKDEFEGRSYWSCKAHESDSSLAWCQDFHSGSQSAIHRNIERSARAVRRIIVDNAVEQAANIKHRARAVLKMFIE